MRRGAQRRDWSKLEVAELRQLRLDGFSTEEIAGFLERSAQAVRFKAHQLQIPRGSVREGRHVDRFWRKVDRRGPDECWLFTGCARDAKGYGCFWDGSRNVTAHGYAFALADGTVPDGHELLHSCDNPPCVNPAHLRPGTHAENMADMAHKGRAA